MCKRIMMPRANASQLGHLKDDRSDAALSSPRKISRHSEDSVPEQTVARSITEQLPSSPHNGPESPQGSRKPKSPGFAESKMDDAILDRLSTLLKSGCSIQLACSEVLAAALSCSIPEPKHCSIQVCNMFANCRCPFMFIPPFPTFPGRSRTHHILSMGGPHP